MTIKDRNLSQGTKLVGRYHKEQHTCQVVAGENGKVRYRLEDGREFKSPSAAGMAITGHACDGWVFWSVETAASAQTIETQKEENTSAVDSALATGPSVAAAQEQNEVPATTAVPGATSAKKIFMRTPNQKGVSEGQTRWYCAECGESFLAPYGELPLACPMGHKA